MTAKRVKRKLSAILSADVSYHTFYQGGIYVDDPPPLKLLRTGLDILRTRF